MARPKKIGVDYFSHDVGAQKKQTVKALRARFGNDGYAFWFILLELLGEREGLYMDCSDEATWIYLCTEVMIAENKVAEMLSFLGRLGAIDKDLWAVDKIIWCQNFTDRLEDAYKKRDGGLPSKPCSKKVSAEKTGVSAGKTTENVEVMPQIKEKKIKENNSTVNTTLEVDTAPVDNSDNSDKPKSENGRSDGLDKFSKSENLGDEFAIKITPVELDAFWEQLTKVYPRKNGISVPKAKEALREFFMRGGDPDDLISAAERYARSVAETRIAEQYMKTPHVFVAGYFKSFVPKFRRRCPECQGCGYIPAEDGSGMIECCCVDRYKEWKI